MPDLSAALLPSMEGLFQYIRPLLGEFPVFFVFFCIPVFARYRVNGATRIRLSTKAIEAWGVEPASGNFRCVGVFRDDGELICAQESARTEDGEHPFESILRSSGFTPPEPGEVIPIEEMPSGFDLVAADRILHFDARWTKGQKQLDLAIGREALERLGYSPSQLEIYLDLHGALIVLISVARYEALRAKPILERK